MTVPVLSDKTVFPSEEIIFKLIGKFKRHWLSLFDWIKQNYHGMSGSWNYYKDGKSWLFKCKEKSNTIFWLSITEQSFQVTFYFNSANEHHFNNSLVPDELKLNYRKQNAGKKFKPVTVMVNSMKDIDTIRTLVDLKHLKNM